MDSTLSIILGLIIIYFASFLLITVFSTLYFMISKRVKVTFGQNLKYSAALGAVNLIVILLSIGLFAGNKILFALATFVLLVAGYYLPYRYLWKFNIIDAMILAGGMAFVLNPIWLTFVGII